MIFGDEYKSYNLKYTTGKYSCWMCTSYYLLSPLSIKKERNNFL
jgi:hypothetical protein